MRYLQIAGALLAFAAIVMFHFSHLKPEEVDEIELAASLEAFHLMQAEYRREHQEFFNPRAEPYRSQLSWRQECDCEVHWSPEGFSVTVRADFRRRRSQRGLAHRQREPRGREAGRGLAPAVPGPVRYRSTG